MAGHPHPTSATAAAQGEPGIRLDSRIDPDVVQRVFKAARRAHVPGILTADAAQRVHRCLTAETPWRTAVGTETSHHDLPVDSLADLEPDERERVVASIEDAARRGFAYRYSNFRIDEHHAAGEHRELFLMRFFEFVNSPPFLEFARRATGFAEIAYADAQATLYRAGDFLTSHDDHAPQKNRLAAYVFNFTPRWQIEWGGLLAFPDQHGHLHEAYGPAFNALNLVRVPTPHLVTQVATFAGAGRYSITGWLRSRRD